MSKSATKAKKPQRSTLLSAKTEYACISLLELARHHNAPSPIPLKQISEAHDISHRFLVQILLQLKSGGLVASVRGASGGYRLAREPDRISIADLVNVIDPPESPKLIDGTGGFIDAVNAVWVEVQAAQRKILEATSLADLLQRADGNGKLTFQI
jgi:Rrf2 family transcriptional regulator, cysteine metabolism repressor